MVKKEADNVGREIEQSEPLLMNIFALNEAETAVFRERVAEQGGVVEMWVHTHCSADLFPSDEEGWVTSSDYITGRTRQIVRAHQEKSVTLSLIERADIQPVVRKYTRYYASHDPSVIVPQPIYFLPTEHMDPVPRIAAVRRVPDKLEHILSKPTEKITASDQAFVMRVAGSVIVPEHDRYSMESFMRMFSAEAVSDDTERSFQLFGHLVLGLLEGNARLASWDAAADQLKRTGVKRVRLSGRNYEEAHLTDDTTPSWLLPEYFTFWDLSDCCDSEGRRMLPMKCVGNTAVNFLNRGIQVDISGPTYPHRISSRMREIFEQRNDAIATQNLSQQ